MGLRFSKIIGYKFGSPPSGWYPLNPKWPPPKGEIVIYRFHVILNCYVMSFFSLYMTLWVCMKNVRKVICGDHLGFQDGRHFKPIFTNILASKQLRRSILMTKYVFWVSKFSRVNWNSTRGAAILNFKMAAMGGQYCVNILASKRHRRSILMSKCIFSGSRNVF